MHAQTVVTAYIGLGSNLADPLLQVEMLMKALADLPGTRRVQCSALYRSAPVGDVTEQPDFVNAACRLDTTATASELMRALLALENERGRVRDGRKGGPRVVDLDLLLYGDSVLQTPDLVIPHPRMHERAFVLYPLHELDPGLVIPGQGPVATLLARCGGQVVERLPSEPSTVI